MVFLAENNKELQIEYTQVNDFGSFISQIRLAAPEYDYVCAKERRCFNLVARFLPKVDMISSHALMLKYDEIAEYYRENGKFPRILILDDLMIHGRSVAKLLQQLEDMLAIRLLEMGVLKRSDNYRYTVYRNLADSVTIFVYARNAGVVFLEEGYQERLYAVKELYAGEMRDLSLQLSRKMRQWDIANTSYVYSVRSEVITECLREQDDGQIGSSEWVRKKWSYGGEEMILYVRLHGRNTVNRVDTIRYFPERYNRDNPQSESLPLLTSFTFFGDLQESVLHRLFERVSGILQNAGLNRLADILKGNQHEQINCVLLQTQVQLISFILSVAVLREFCQDVIPDNRLNDIVMRGDIWKISRNFGRRDEIRSELLQIRGKALRNELKEAILCVIDEEAEELIQVDPMEALAQAGSSDDMMSAVNDDVRRAIYHVGMQSERTAYEQSARPRRFMPEEYQEHCGSDGLISLKELARKKRFSEDSGSIFSYLSAFIAMMDSCAVGVRTKAICGKNGETKVCTLAKVGEMASFYLPEKLAMFVPVFAVLERNTFGTPDARKRNLRYYLKELVRGYFGQDNSILMNLVGDQNQAVRVRDAAIDALELKQEGGILVLSDKLLKEIDMFYDGGHSFYDWNFGNLSVKRKIVDDRYRDAYQGILKLSKHLICEIEAMNSFILPPED